MPRVFVLAGLVLMVLPLWAQESDKSNCCVRLEEGQVTSLVGQWKFKTGDDPNFSNPTLDDSSWASIRMPQYWHQAGFDYDGIAWYRLQLIVPSALQKRGLGFILPIRPGWHEIYFNGVRITDERTLDQVSHKSFATQTIPIVVPHNLVNLTGPNVLSIRARSMAGIGGFFTRSMYAGSHDQLEKRYSLQLVFVTAMSALFLLTGLTHAITFSGRRKDYQYLYFALFSVSIGFMVVSINNLTHFIFDSFYYQYATVHIPVIFSPFLLTQFSHTFYGIKRRKFPRAMLVVCTLFLVLFISSCISTTMYGLYLKKIFPCILGLAFISVIYTLIVTIRAVRMGVFTARIIGLGFLIFGVSAFNDILTYLKVIDMPYTLEEGFLGFVISMSTSLSLKFSRLHFEMARLNSRLRSNVRALESARRTVAESEKKYRELVESSNDIVFTLDSSGSITMINQAAGELLGIPAQDLIGQNFQSLIYFQGDHKNSLARHIAREKLSDVIMTKKDVTFRADFFTRTREPRNLQVKLQYMSHGEDYIIAGKASYEVQDELIGICRSERQNYVFGNFIHLSDSLSQRMYTAMLKYAHPDVAYALKICLREIIINAIEHGNLAISFDEKTESQTDGTYFSLLLVRQSDPIFSERKVRLKYSLNEKRVVFFVLDEGAGFDHADVMSRDIRDPKFFNLAHGRGIAMARTEFDRVYYNKKGNGVFLVKNFPAEELALNKA